MRELPQWAENRKLSAILSKYRAQHERSYAHEDVRRVVCGLSLIVRLWSFGYGMWAINAAYLLDRSEPLEELAPDSLPVAQMRIFQLTYQKQFDKAQQELEQAYGVFGEDAVLVRMRVWLHELKEGKC